VSQNIALFGLGTMGTGMASNLLKGVNPTLTLVANYLLWIESFVLDGDFKPRKIRTSSSTAV
jgi:hypothetical protein